MIPWTPAYAARVVSFVTDEHLARLTWQDFQIHPCAAPLPRKVGEEILSNEILKRRRK